MTTSARGITVRAVLSRLYIPSGLLSVAVALTLTAGASAPEILVEQVIDVLKEKGFNTIREVEVMPENVRFGLPPEIVEAIAAAPAAAE